MQHNAIHCNNTTNLGLKIYKTGEQAVLNTEFDLGLQYNNPAILIWTTLVKVEEETEEYKAAFRTFCSMAT